MVYKKRDEISILLLIFKNHPITSSWIYALIF